VRELPLFLIFLKSISSWARIATYYFICLGANRHYYYIVFLIILCAIIFFICWAKRAVIYYYLIILYFLPTLQLIYHFYFRVTYPLVLSTHPHAYTLTHHYIHSSLVLAQRTQPILVELYTIYTNLQRSVGVLV